MFSNIKAAAGFAIGSVMFQLLLAVVTLLPLAFSVPSTFDNQHIWVVGNLSAPISKNAISGGGYPDGRTIYVGRMIDKYENIYPARVVAETGYAYYGYTVSSGNYFRGYTREYQLLVPHSNMTYQWSRSYDGLYEKGAVIVGTSRRNEPVTICRSWYLGSLLIGYVIPSIKQCYIDDYLLSNNSATIERFYSKYEILRATPKLC